MGKFMTLSNKNDIKMYLSGDNKKAERILILCV